MINQATCCGLYFERLAQRDQIPQRGNKLSEDTGWQNCNDAIRRTGVMSR